VIVVVIFVVMMEVEDFRNISKKTMLGEMLGLILMKKSTVFKTKTFFSQFEIIKFAFKLNIRV
jgi:hypothetical protein